MRSSILICVAILLCGCGGIVDRELPRGDDAAPTPVAAPTTVDAPVDATAAIDSAPEPAATSTPVDVGPTPADAAIAAIDAGSSDATFDAVMDAPVDAGPAPCCTRLTNTVAWNSPEAAAAADLPWYLCTNGTVTVGTITSSQLDGQAICGY